VAVLSCHPPFHGDPHDIFRKTFDDLNHGLLLHFTSTASHKISPASSGGLQGRMLWLLELDKKLADQIVAEKPAVRDVEARRERRRRLATIKILGCR
jgi:hypothetical protein